jgi:hypothetical protein
MRKPRSQLRLISASLTERYAAAFACSMMEQASLNNSPCGDVISAFFLLYNVVISHVNQYLMQS